MGEFVWFLILLGVAIAFLLLFSFMTPAEALSRVDENIAKSAIDAAENQIVKLDKSIEKQKILMSNIIDEIERLKSVLRQVKSDASISWDAVKNIDKAEQDVVNAEQKLVNAREHFQNLLSLKSDQIKIIKYNEEVLLEPRTYIQYAKTNVKIGIQLSNTCITMIMNDIDSTCPTYKNLISLDSSDTSISGRFNENFGMFQRMEPSVQNSWRSYDFDDTPRIFVDPPKGMAERIKTIQLQPNFDTYVLTHNLSETRDAVYVNGTNGIGVKTTGETFRILYHDIYVDPNCRSATVNADKWELLLANVIYYMKNNCQEEFKTFENEEIIPTTFTQQDITTSQKYQYDQWVEQIKSKCIFKYKACDV